MSSQKLFIFYYFAFACFLSCLNSSFLSQPQDKDLTNLSSSFLNPKKVDRPPRNPQDNSSYSNTNEVITTKFKLSIKLDFDNSIISGTNTLFVQAVIDEPKQLIVDIQAMEISKVETAFKDDCDAEDIPFKETNQITNYYDQDLGSSAFIVAIEQELKIGEKFCVRFTYNTLNTTSQVGLNWLNNSQTATKRQKYFYTQCHPTHCRSLAPMQDTPSIRVQFTLIVTSPGNTVTYMTGTQIKFSGNFDGTVTYTYSSGKKNNFPINTIAFVVGHIRSKFVKDKDSRVIVLSERGGDYLNTYSQLLKDKSDEYLVEIESYLGITNQQWKDNEVILVQPPSFPFAAVNYGSYQYVSPTVLVDGTQQMIRYGFAKQWFGTYVSNRDWSNAWLNEGFSNFVARKVLQKIQGVETAKIEAQLGDVDLWVDINNYGVSSSYSSLYPVLNGHSPDDSFSEVPYEKGFQFLTYLESLVGADNFQAWIRLYILNFAQQSITYLEMKAHFIDWVTNTLYKGDQKSIDKVLNAIDWAAWIQQGGKNPPAWNISFATDSAKTYEKLADDYITLQGTDHPKNYDIYLKETDPQLKVIFLNRLISRQNELNYNLLVLIDADYNCTWDKNPEIGQRWLPLAIAMGYEEAYGDNLSGAHYYVSYQGRMKYINPIYQQLVRYGRRDLAYKWFSEFQNFYHPIAVAGLKKIIFASVDAEEEKLLNRTMKALASGRIRL
eukprot:403367448